MIGKKLKKFLLDRENVQTIKQDAYLKFKEKENGQNSFTLEFDDLSNVDVVRFY